MGGLRKRRELKLTRKDRDGPGGPFFDCHIPKWQPLRLADWANSGGRPQGAPLRALTETVIPWYNYYSPCFMGNTLAQVEIGEKHLNFPDRPTNPERRHQLRQMWRVDGFALVWDSSLMRAKAKIAKSVLPAGRTEIVGDGCVGRTIRRWKIEGKMPRIVSGLILSVFCAGSFVVAVATTPGAAVVGMIFAVWATLVFKGD